MRFVILAATLSGTLMSVGACKGAGARPDDKTTTPVVKMN